MQAVITIADELDKIGGLEQAAAEAEGRKAAAEASLGEVRSKIEVEEANLAAASRKIDDVKAKAYQIIDEAKDKGSQIVADAKAKAEAEAAEIRAEGEKALEKIMGKVADAKGELDAVNGQIVSARESLDAVRAEEADLIKRAEKAKDYLAKLAGK